MKREVILFDINETVLNLEGLKPKFKDVFGDEAALPLWFSKLLHASTVCIATKVQSNFSQLSDIMLESVAMSYQVSLTATQKNDLLSAFACLSPHSDIKNALNTLRKNGFKTVAFSNSSTALISTQIKNSGLSDLFDEIISVENTGSFKPDLNVYRYAAKILGQPVEMLRLVATHDWDTHGALSAGLKAAYIHRANYIYNPLYLKPDIKANTMDEIVKQIIEKQ